MHKLHQHIYIHTLPSICRYQQNIKTASLREQLCTLRQYETAESGQQSVVTSLMQCRQRPQQVRDGKRCLIGQQSQQPQRDVRTHLQQHLATRMKYGSTNVPTKTIVYAGVGSKGQIACCSRVHQHEHSLNQE